MMSVKEYASDVNVSVSDIIKLCNNLGIAVSNEDDMLDDDAIIILDNEIANCDNLNDEVEESNLDIKTIRNNISYFANIFYVLKLGTISVALLRAVSAIPGHACDAVFMGYYLSLAKQSKILKKPEKEKNRQERT